MLYKFSFLVFFCLFNITIKAQTENVLLIEKYLKKSKELSQKNVDSSFLYIEKGIRLAKEINRDSLLAKTYLQQSSLYLLSNKFKEADSILKLNFNKNIPKHLEGQTWHNLATIEYKKQHFEKALDLYITAAKLTEESGNKKLLVNTYTNMGIINARLGNLKNAQRYLEKVITFLDKDTPLELQVLVNLISIYKQQKLFKKFEAGILKAEKLAQKYKSKRTLSIIYNNLSDYYTSDKSNFKKSVFYGEKAISLKKELNHNAYLSLPYNNLGHAYLKNKKYKQAILYLDSALPNAKGLLKSYVYNNLKNAYLGLTNYKKAMHFAELKDVIKDSLNNAKQKEKVTEITEKYESEKKEQQITLLNTENQLQESKIHNQKNLLIGVVLTIFLLGSLAFLWFKNQKTKQSLQQASLKHKLLQTQLNPHFLFHSLNSIQSFIYLNKKEESLDYLGNYSKLMRSIFDNSSTDFITINKDVEAMNAYLKLQHANFENNVSFSLEVAEDISDFLIPPMFVQPYIENAIQHGIKNIENGKVSIKYHNKKDAIEVIIFDNGKGIKTKNNNYLLEKNSSSHVIEERIKILQKTHNYTIKHQVESSSNGTTVLLTFPKKRLI